MYLQFGIGHRAEEYEHIGSTSAGAAGSPMRTSISCSGCWPAIPSTCGTADVRPRHTGRGNGRRPAHHDRRRHWWRRRVRPTGTDSGFIAQTTTPGLVEALKPASLEHGNQSGRSSSRTRPVRLWFSWPMTPSWPGRRSAHPAARRPDGGVRHRRRFAASITHYRHRQRNRKPQDIPMGAGPSMPQPSGSAGKALPLHPLCGGMPPKLAWPYLERVAAAVSAARSAAG